MLHGINICMHFVGDFCVMKITEFCDPVMDMEDKIGDEKEQLQVKEPDDSCKVDFIEIVPLSRDTDGSCTTECVSGDWSAEVKLENLAVVKQEPDDVCCAICYIQFFTTQKYCAFANP